MQRLMTVLFFIGFSVIATLVLYAANLKLAYNLTTAQTFDREIADWTFGMLLTSMVGVGFSVLGLYWVRETLLATRGTAEAAREANAITRSAIETSERAWIISKVKPMGKITMDANGNWRVPIVVENKNAGKTPALNVSTKVVAACYDDVGKCVAYMKKEAEGIHERYGIMISPGDVFERRWGFSTTMVDEAYHSSNEVPQFILGCVSYSTIFDEKVHYTIFVYDVSRDTGHESGHANAALYDGMGPEEVYLWPWTGSHAT